MEPTKVMQKKQAKSIGWDSLRITLVLRCVQIYPEIPY